MNEQNIVKKVCKELGITQKELAERLGVTSSAISQWGDNIPKTSLVAMELLLENKKLKEDLKTILKAQQTINKLLDVQNLDT